MRRNPLLIRRGRFLFLRLVYRVFVLGVCLRFCCSLFFRVESLCGHQKSTAQNLLGLFLRGSFCSYPFLERIVETGSVAANNGEGREREKKGLGKTRPSEEDPYMCCLCFGLKGYWTVPIKSYRLLFAEKKK